MDRDFKATLIATILCAGAVVLQSTLLHWVALRGIKPDPALIILVYTAVRRGSMSGQVTGFASGILEDLLSLSPVGFHALSRTVIGYLYGRMEGKIFLDPILMPLLLTIIATILKGFVAAFTVLLFAVDAPGFKLFAGPLWIEVGYNAVLAPFVFALLSLVKPLRPRDVERA
ncbi:MAG: rod shape-determining protein MreD [Spirochaetales bacterium]|nr:rod shape-determining protein MreD [Spirochaetales bacterium]